MARLPCRSCAACAPRCSIWQVEYPQRQAAIRHYIDHLDISVKTAIKDSEDQTTALQQDRQGLGCRGDEKHAGWRIVMPVSQYPKRLEKLVYLEAGYDWSAPVFFKAFGEWAQFINTWIELKRCDGTIDALYGHWILGKHASSKVQHP